MEKSKKSKWYKENWGKKVSESFKKSRPGASSDSSETASNDKKKKKSKWYENLVK